jgi:hypothetical protein
LQPHVGGVWREVQADHSLIGYRVCYDVEVNVGLALARRTWLLRCSAASRFSHVDHIE